jgi:DNA-binding winged helix-turn-helix (wHTH) protein/TolB-like protein/Flp pilus assembly protein TadD
VLRFGVFELDAEKGELRRSGMLIKLAPQPLQILRLLVERAEEIVTREEIRQAVWGAETFVDFDRNLNVAVAQIRAALGDDAESPRYVATAPRKGYRFVAPVEGARRPPADLEVRPTTDQGVRPTRQPSNGRWWVIGLIGAALLVAGAMVFGRRGPVDRTLIAVLPFEDTANRPLLREALLEDTIGQLSGIQPLRLGVIARTSAARLDAKHAGIGEIGTALKAQYVVEGSIRESGGLLRVAARLIQTRDQAEVWAGTLEDASERVLERDAPARIAAGVLQSLFPNAPPPRRIAERCGAASDAYRNGRYLQAKGDVVRAAELFQTVNACAEADAALADALFMMSRMGRATAADLDRASEAARRALHAEPENLEAMTALANLEFWKLWRFAEAEVHFKKVLEVNPSSAAAYHDYAWLLIATGRAPDGVAALRKALALDPLSPRVNIDAGWLLLQARRYDEAAAQARRAQEIEPAVAPEARACEARARIYRDGAQADPAMFPHGPYFTTIQAALRGDRAAALDGLEKLVAERNMMMVTLDSEPAFDKLRDEPRFRALVAKVGLP